MTVDQFEFALMQGPYAWPGGYPMFFIMKDGEPLSFKAANAEKERIIEAIKDPHDSDTWKPIDVDINWEDDDLFCAHTGEKIYPAYPPD